MSYLDGLNNAQKEAVTTTEGPMLVVAGAGSGKTRVIEYRVAHLLGGGVDPRSILLLTFTRKAAREMLSRASRHDSRSGQVDGGTFHSFAYKALSRYGGRVGLPKSFSILDEGDAEEAIHRCCTEMGVFEKKEKFPKKGTLRAVISASVNKDMSVESVLSREYAHFLDFAPFVGELRKKYAEYKLGKGYLDYDDLLVYLVKLLKDEGMRESVARRYRYVMVDEYQDTNVLQGDVVHLLGKGHGNVMVVGDDAQSIYGFRGASHENIMKFPRRFPGCKVVKLEENYRSVQPILDVANSVLTNMERKFKKSLVSATGASGRQPAFVSFPNAYKEGEWIAEKIKELEDDGVRLGGQAVLFRSSYVSIPLQAELAKRGISFQLFGGRKFYELAHVKDVVVHLRVLANHRDELAWSRGLQLIEGIGPKTCGRLLDKIMMQASLTDVLGEVFGGGERQAYSGGLERLSRVLKSLLGKGSLGKRVGLVLDYYGPILERRYDDWHKRVGDLEVLKGVAERYGSLGDFLADFAIDPVEVGVDREVDSRKEPPLTLSTIHSAKGLEWDVVFLLGLSEGVLPSSFAFGDEDDIEEEHRLFYVAVTRAKKQLFFSFPFESVRSGDGAVNEISRFLTAPNVLSCVEQKVLFAPRSSEASVSCDDPEKSLRDLGAGEDEDDWVYDRAVDIW